MDVAVTPDNDARLSNLLRAALAGSETDYARFLREVAAVIRRAVARRIGGARGIDAEDIVQETLLAVHLKRHTWRSDQPVGPWIHAIARYKVADAFRRRGRAVEVDIADFENVLTSQDMDAPREREVSRALAGLPDGQRSVVAAIGVEGRSIAETAEALGMKEGAIRVALHRGLGAIAARFGKTP